MARFKKQIQKKNNKTFNCFDSCFNQRLVVTPGELHPVFSHYLLPGSDIDVEGMLKKNNNLVFTVTIKTIFNS